MSKSLHMAMTFVALDKVGCRVFSSLFGQGLVPYGHWILPSLFQWALLKEEHSTPSPVAQCKSLFFHNNAAAQTHLSLKGASKWNEFSLISAHRYYAETPHEVNILTSFLKRIWIKLSKSVSQLKIGLFLCVLDQNYILSDTPNICGWKTCGQWHTDFTNLFDVNQGYIELV